MAESVSKADLVAAMEEMKLRVRATQIGFAQDDDSFPSTLSYWTKLYALDQLDPADDAGAGI